MSSGSTSSTFSSSSAREVVLYGSAAAAIVGCGWAAWTIYSKGKTKTKKVVATDFESYLQCNIENPSFAYSEAKNTLQHKKANVAPTSFEAYLKNVDGANGLGPATINESETHNSSVKESIPEGYKVVTILYGTEFGFSREVAETLCENLKETKRFWPELLDMGHYPDGLPLEKAQALFVVCSTQGDGVPPTEARDFCSWFLSDKAPQLNALPFSVCALGDRSYAHFARCGKTLDKRLEKLGGNKILSRADINKEDWNTINRWIDGVLKALENFEDQLQAASELDGVVPGSILAQLEEMDDDECEPQKIRYKKSQPYYAKVIAVDGLCDVTNKAKDKCTMRIEIDLGESELTYLPGDALGVWPTNNINDVDEILRCIRADGDIRVQIPAWHYKDLIIADGKDKDQSGSISVRNALLKCYDLKQPKKVLLRTLLQRLHDVLGKDNEETQKENIHRNNGVLNGEANQEFGVHRENGEMKENLCANGCIIDAIDRLEGIVSDTKSTAKYLENRHVIDILEEFPQASCNMPIIELLNGLQQLAPRLYSISSSPLENPQRVTLTIAVVNYNANNRDREGVCSTFLGQRIVPGDTIPIYMYPNNDFRLPQDDSTPIIMVGPGTGVAPFRAFLMDRALRKRNQVECSLDTVEKTSLNCTQDMLYFGCRRRDQDFLYRSELENLAESGHMQLFTAFSREGTQKVYVQDRLRENSEAVWTILSEHKGYFYICGDGEHMSGAVEATLVDIASKKLPGGRIEAEKWLAELKDQRRFQKDVW